MSVRADCVCGRRLEVDKSLAGRWVECPECHRQIHIPGLAESDPDIEAKPEPAKAKRKRSSQPIPTADLPVAQPITEEPMVAELIEESDAEIIEAVSIDADKPMPRSRAKSRRDPVDDDEGPPPNSTKCPYCGAWVKRRGNSMLLQCRECESEFSENPARRRKKKKKSNQPKSKFRGVKQVVSDNRESIPIWAKWAGIVVAAIFGFVVIAQVFAKTAYNVEMQGLRDGVVNGIQDKYREKRLSDPSLPTIQINDLRTLEPNEDGLIPFEAEMSRVIVVAQAGRPIYGLIDRRNGRWAYGFTPIDSFDSPNVALEGSVSTGTQSIYGAIAVLVMIVFLATLLMLAKRFVF